MNHKDIISNGTRRRLRPGPYNVILRYHSVGGGFHDDIPPVRFRQDMEYLSERYEVVDLSAAVASPKPEKKIALTFDDGYRDFYEHVRPILHEFDIPATVFVISETLSDDGFAHDDAYEYEYMSASQLRELVDDDLVTIGNHTRTHPDLTAISDPEAIESEVVGAKRDLERELSTKITRFSYPYQKFDSDALDIVSRSHEYAVAGTERSLLSLQTANPCRLPRLNGAIDRTNLEYRMTDRGLLRRHLTNHGRRFIPSISRVES